MIQPCKICGISDSKTLEFLTSHPTPPKMIGFICNWPKSKRFVENNKLRELLKVDKKNSKYVAVLVKPNEDILEKIKNLPFDYYQLYDCTPIEVKAIKDKYFKKIILPNFIKKAFGKYQISKWINKSKIILQNDKKNFKKLNTTYPS